uniref:N-acetyltransferase domain-containing protein n=1 Tax=Candidatus Kentrum sp. FM TaxID=2126340 RepID=A0A450S564_9GAMM|nr:MAG: hypothetical protein BECKFM1743A_GA0114220_1004210 [Candidatus Kentron sp. FM]VFJ47345.1 MAG: hypothetical protein BECKFM1743C_GA0114222_1004410 [Candidatus Kentron sp. FM]VFK07560.1 MAG: hypothetical protein BECKFM1743B_GA0114221_100449 [Candidatus Kentron sp. FM]
MVSSLKATLSRVRRVSDGPMPGLLMMASMVGLVAMLGSFLLTPLPVALLIGLVIYAMLAVAELSQGIVSPITQTSLFLFSLSALAFFGGGFEAWIPYTGSLFLGALFVVSAGFLAAGRPFTVFYSAGRGHRTKHWVVSGMWTMAYLIGALLALLLMPNISFIYAPMLIVMGAAVLTLVFNLFWFGSATRRATEFQYESFRFTEIGDDLVLLEQFYTLAAREFWPSVRRSSTRSLSSLAELREQLWANDRPYGARILRFMAWKDAKPVGTICCILDHPRTGLPVEEESGFRIDKLRRVGKVMEIGKLAIASSYRTRQPLFLGLLRCVIEVAMEYRLSFIINDSYVSQAGLYRKIGFIDGAHEPFVDANGAECLLLWLNLSKAVIYENSRDDNTSMSRLIPLLNDYLTERFYHRLVLRHFRHTRQYRPYDLPAAAFSLKAKQHG